LRRFKNISKKRLRIVKIAPYDSKHKEFALIYMTISKTIFHQDPIEGSPASRKQSHLDFMTFSEEKFRRDVVYYAFLITSSKYLEVPYLPKRFTEEEQ